MRTLAALALFVMLALVSYASQAIGLPVVISATVDYTHSTLTISGQNFGSNPSVTLDALAFPTQSGASTGTQIVANFPSGKAPSSFTPGTYFLTVTFKNQLPTIFGVDIGANGAAGPAGGILALINLYTPHAKTASFNAEADQFRRYAIAWRDRWNSVMELFMAGGNYPVAEIPFPLGFSTVIEAEIAPLK